MKTFFTRLLLLASVMLAAAGLQAQGDEFKILFDVGFEDGRIPDDWEIVNERGDEDWKIVSGDSYGGGGRHVELRNGTSVQKNYRTLLIAPAVDVSTAYQPIVVFAHRQRQWTGDVDTLRVMYRTSADKEWTELGHFGNAVDEWKMDTLFLNDPGTTYQVAFMGSDNMGGGIELDNICVRSYPRCEQPSNFQVNNLTNDTEERLTLLEEGLIHVSLLLLIRRKHASVHPIAIYPAGILLKELLEIIIDSQRSEGITHAGAPFRIFHQTSRSCA